MPDPTSAARLPMLDVEALDPQQLALRDAVVGGPRANGPFSVTDEQGRLLGPFNSLLLVPAVGDAVQRLGAALRFGGALPDRTRELVVCAVAAYRDCDYEWYAHSRVALSVGLRSDQLAELRDGQAPAGLSPGESAALGLTRALLRGRSIGQPLWADAVAHHGEAAVVELTVLIGYYQMLAGLLAAVDVGAPGDDDGADPG